MSINTTSGRVGDLTQTEYLLAALRNNQAQLQRLQAQIATGSSLLSVGDDPMRAGQVIGLSALLGRLDQYQTNANRADAMLTGADTALGEAADLLRQAYTLALASASDTASDSERAANAQQLDTLIDQMQRLANRQVQGRYLFDGQSGQGAPFGDFDAGVLYTGAADPLRVAMDRDWTLSAALDGASVFGGESQAVGTTRDLNPRADAATRLADLNGAAAAGIAPGSIRVSDGVNDPQVLDLSRAANLGDVIALFNAQAPAGTTLSLAANGKQLVVSSAEPGAKLTIEDVGGTTARDLGILAGGTASTVTGLDIDPRLTATTPIAYLAGGAGLDLTGLTIANGARTANLSLASATTVGDILNAINAAGVGASASIDPNGRSLRLTNRLSGSGMIVLERGGQTATQLGLRTFQIQTPLSSLNGGQGVGKAGNGLADFRITQRDGTTIEVNIGWCASVGDVLGAINAAPGNTGDLVASISLTGGIQLLDSSADGGSLLSVESRNSSTAAMDLGLEQAVSEATLVGWDVSGLDCDGVFSHLLALRRAISQNNADQIIRTGALVQSDMDRLVELRGAVGAQSAEVAARLDRIAQERLDNETLLSQVRDVDLNEAIIQFQQLQTQLTASMLTIGKLLSLSLLDFID